MLGEKQNLVGKTKKSSNHSETPLEFSLSRLERISIFSGNNNFPMWGIDPAHTLPYLALPSVSAFSAQVMIDTFDRDGSETVFQSSCRLSLPQFKFKTTELIMNHSAMEGWQVGEYVSYFNVLKKFEYMIEYTTPS